MRLEAAVRESVYSGACGMVNGERSIVVHVGTGYALERIVVEDDSDRYRIAILDDVLLLEVSLVDIVLKLEPLDSDWWPLKNAGEWHPQSTT